MAVGPNVVELSPRRVQTSLDPLINAREAPVEDGSQLLPELPEKTARGPFRQSSS